MMQGVVNHLPVGHGIGRADRVEGTGGVVWCRLADGSVRCCGGVGSRESAGRLAASVTPAESRPRPPSALHYLDLSERNPSKGGGLSDGR